MIICASFLSAASEGGGCPDLINFVFLPIVRFFIAQDHGSFACVFRIIIPDRFGIVNWIFLFLNIHLLYFFLLPIKLGVSQKDTALIVIVIKT